MVQLYIAFLPQHGICFIHRVHIDPDLFCHITHRREILPLGKILPHNRQDDLVAKLDIQRFIAVKINGKYTRESLLPVFAFVCSIESVTNILLKIKVISLVFFFFTSDGHF